MAKFLCHFCNLVKTTDDEKRYVYASSKKEVKVYVCESCHNGKLTEMHDEAASFMGKSVVLGVLKGKPKSLTE